MDYNFQRTLSRNASVSILTFYFEKIISGIKIGKCNFVTCTNIHPIFVVTRQTIRISVAAFVQKVKRCKFYCKCTLIGIKFYFVGSFGRFAQRRIVIPRRYFGIIYHQSGNHRHRQFDIIANFRRIEIYKTVCNSEKHRTFVIAMRSTHRKIFGQQTV